MSFANYFLLLFVYYPTEFHLNNMNIFRVIGRGHFPPPTTSPPPPPRPWKFVVDFANFYNFCYKVSELLIWLSLSISANSSCRVRLNHVTEISKICNLWKEGWVIWEGGTPKSQITLGEDPKKTYRGSLTYRNLCSENFFIPER